MERSASRVEGGVGIFGLTRGGTLAALLVGGCVLAAGGWPYAAVLLSFFIPSMLLSRAGKPRKRSLTDTGNVGARNARQVFANGGIAAACALLSIFTHHALFAAAFAGAFAAASADTWGTEIGTLSKTRPRSILTFKPLLTGLSGGVSLPGTLAEIAGALLPGAVSQALGVAPWWMVTFAGVAGAMADSIAGAGFQELRYCDRCRRACETNPHGCGQSTRRISGVSWIGNDAVNGVCTLTGALAGAALLAAFR